MDENGLPDIYTPSSLRFANDIFEKTIKYGIGIEHRAGEAGMIAGPFETVEECLDIIPGEDKKVFIYELPLGRKLYRWHYPSWYKL
jgi:hypothetical protein